MCRVGGVRMKRVGSGWIGLKKKEGFTGMSDVGVAR